MSQLYTEASLHYPSSSSSTLHLSACPSLSSLKSQSSLLLLWRHNPDVCHFHRPEWATHTHTHRTGTHTAGQGNDITPTPASAHSNAFLSEGILSHSRAEQWHLIMSQMKQEWMRRRGETEGWTERNGTAEQYGGGWVELCANEAKGARIRGMKKAARQTKNYSSFTVVKSTSTCIFYAMNKKK